MISHQDSFANHIIVVIPGVHPTEYKPKALDDKKRTAAVDDHERRVETDLQEQTRKG